MSKDILTQPLPQKYIIDPCNICNLKCIYCPTGLKWKNFSRGIMTIDSYNIILNKIKKYAKEIYLYNWGEPFLNKDIIKIISITNAENITTTIHSNLSATVFDDNYAIGLVKSGLTTLSASIDGASQKTYEKYRVGGKIDRAFNNLKKVVYAKRKLNSQTPNIVWQFLINKNNEHEVSTAIQMASEFGVNINFQPMDLSGNKEMESAYHNDYKRLHKLQRRVALHRIKHMPLKLFITKSIKYLQNKIYLMNNKNNDKIILDDSLPDWCSNPFDTMIINWNGDVLPCCNVFHDKMSIGNILKEDINFIWNNNEFKRCREYLYNYNSGLRAGSVCEQGLCPVNNKSLLI